jgi:competence protein ComEC
MRARFATVWTRSPAPHLLAGALCAGLASSLALRIRAPAPVAAAFALALIATTAGRRRSLALALAFLAAGWWWGSARLDALDESLLANRTGEAAAATVVVTGPSRRSRFSIRVPVRVRQFGRLSLDEPARLRLPPKRAPPQGAVLELVALVERPEGAKDDGSYDEARYLRRLGVHVVLRADRYRVVGHRGGLGGVADRLRAGLARSLAPGVHGERRAVIAGIVLGEDEGLSARLQNDFRASGLYHLLAVSGQNVAYVVIGMLFLAWVLGLPRWCGHAAALAGVGAYVLAVGWQPSVVRAAVAGALASLAWLVARPPDRWYFLLLGAGVLLLWNPYSLLEPGFQLSFVAVVAIFLVVPVLDRRLEGYPIPPGLAEPVAVSLACGVATAPVLFLQFGAVPLFSVLANALAAPVVAPLLGLALIAAGLDYVLPDAAAALAWGNGWLAAYLAGCARLVGRLPRAQVRSLAGLALVAGLAGAVLLVARVPGARRAAATAAVLALFLVGWAAWPRPVPPLPPHDFRLTMLDVGQGDGILLQVPQGAVLVDSGPPEARVADQLRDLGIRRLAALVITHLHRDHVGGAVDVLDRIPVGFVLDPFEPTREPFELAARADARRRHVPLTPARVGESYRLGRLKIRVLWPDGGGILGEDPHDHCIVLLVSYRNLDVLMTGDAESNVTLPLRLPPVEILKVAHHGSADPGLPQLLQRLRPRIALISVGRHNDYGHPTPLTISELHRFPGLALYRTDQDGRITVDSDGAHIQVREAH